MRNFHIVMRNPCEITVVKFRIMTYNIIKVLLLNYYAEVPRGIFILLRCIKSMGFSVRRIQQMCKNGELPGAIKEGRKWLIPDETIHMNHFAKNKSLPIGVSDFKLATTGYYYVDKTLMIRDFLDKKADGISFHTPKAFWKNSEYGYAAHLL